MLALRCVPIKPHLLHKISPSFFLTTIRSLCSSKPPHSHKNINNNKNNSGTNNNNLPSSPSPSSLVSPSKKQSLAKTQNNAKGKAPEKKEIIIDEKELEEKFVLGTGPGGQSVNKTSNTVFLKHIPTGVFVKVNKTRSRAENRKIARNLLRDKLDLILNGKQSKIELQREKIRKRKAKRKKRAVDKANQNNEENEDNEESEEYEDEEDDSEVQNKKSK